MSEDIAKKIAAGATVSASHAVSYVTGGHSTGAGRDADRVAGDLTVTRAAD